MFKMQQRISLNNLLGFLRKSQINYCLKLILESYFKLLTSDISLKSDQCHSKVEKSGGQTMGQNTEKSDFFSVISTNLTKTRDRGAY